MSSCCRKTCDYPTVDSYTGQLREIFNKLGRTGLSNLLAHPDIKEYIKFAREEQDQQQQQLHQAVPFFYDKFIHLVVYLQGLITDSSALSPINRYLLVRDVTFFVVDFNTGNTASDLGRLQTDQVFHLKDREGFLLNFTFGKTKRKGRPHPFALLRISHVPVCPVFWLNYYIAACKTKGVPLLNVYFSRSSENKLVSHCLDMALYYMCHSTVSASSQLLQKITLHVTSPGCQPPLHFRSKELANDLKAWLYHSNQGPLIVASKVWLFFVK